MRPRRPKHSSVGSELRDALNKSRANEDAREQQRETEERDAQSQSLSNWFNDVAKQIPVKVQEISAAAKRGVTPATDFSFSAADAGVSLRDAGAVDLEALPGFQKLDSVCNDLDIECTVTQGRRGYGRKAHAGEAYLTVHVDAGQPYQPLTVETPRPPGYRGRR
jgi:hypothetical protein